MDLGIRAVGAMIGVSALLVLTPAPAGATVVSLGTVSQSYAPPRVVVDAIGVGYTSWAGGQAGQPLGFCRLAPHAGRCEAPQTFSFPGEGTSVDAGNAPVFTAGGQLAILDSRCCLLSNQKELLISSDHGTTFTGPTPNLADAASGMTGNVLDLPAGTLGAGTPEELLTSSTDSVTGGGSIQAAGLTPATTDPGWYTPPVASGSLSESLGRSGSTLLAVYTNDTVPHYSVSWVRYQGGDPNAASSWSAPQPLSPAPSLDSNAQLASGPAGIVVARSIATPGDNEELVVQRFTGSGWSSPVVLSKTAAGERFAVTETPKGTVYVTWRDVSGPLYYAVAANRSASRFGKAIRVATHGEVEFPQIAVNGEGAGWITWSNDTSPSHVSAFPIVPRPRITKAGVLRLQTPRECVAIGGSFPVAVTASGTAQPSSVRVGLVGGKTKPVAHTTLTLTSPVKTKVVATVRLPAAHGHTRVKTISATVIACP